MPASVNETVTASLLLSLSNRTGPENGEVSLDQRMAAASQRVLLNDIEYEISTDTYHNSVLQGLKSKYTEQNDNASRLTNGSSNQSARRSNQQASNPTSLPIPSHILYPAEKVQMQWPQRCNNGSGFINAGNTCYLNSVLQALFHLPPMVHWLTEGDHAHQRTCPTFNNNTPECIICCLAVTLRQSQQRVGGDTRPHLILQRLRSICKRLVLGQQEDAMEFLRYLFEAIEKCFLQRFRNLKLDSYSKETTPLSQIFGGYLRTEVTCLQCRAVSTTFQHIIDLTLDISRGSSLEHALETYFGKERLDPDNPYTCGSCGKKVLATKQFFLERLPNILCIQLKRFNVDGKKISKCLQLSERINVQRFISWQRQNAAGSSIQAPRPRSTCYRLAAGVNHLGHTSHSGHYTTTAYTSNGQLYLFDDSSVQRSWSRGFSGNDVYLLMYLLEPGKQEASIPVPTATATSTPVVSQQPSPRPVQVKANTFVPAQCRLKPSIILNQNRKLVFGPSPVVETIKPKSPLLTAVANGKQSKLGVVLPTTKESPLLNVQNNSSSSTSASPVKEKIAVKARNGSSLVPYKEEEQSSADETGKSTEPSATPSTNGWTVTENGHSPNKTSDDEALNSKYDKSIKSENKKLKVNSDTPFVNSNQLHESPVKKTSKLVIPESPKTSTFAPKTNGLDSPKKANQDASKKPVKMTGNDTAPPKMLTNGDHSLSEQSESSVKSTTSSWRVTDCEAPVEAAVAAAEKRSTSWVVTPASGSEPTSSEPSPGPQPSPSPPPPPSITPLIHNQQQQSRATVKRKVARTDSSSSSSESSSSSDSSDSDDSSKKSSHRKKKTARRVDEYVWVERTKEDIVSNGVQKTPAKRPAPTPAYKPLELHTTVTDELRKMSHAGYGGAHVATWNGGRSLVERQVQDERRERRRQSNQDCEYDAEIDGGRKKKIKSHHEYSYKYEAYKGNRFQQEADSRRSSYNGGYERKEHWGSRDGYSQHYHSGGYHHSWRGHGGSNYRSGHGHRNYSNNNRHKHHSSHNYRHSDGQYNNRYHQGYN